MEGEGISADGKVLRRKQVELQEKRKRLLQEHKRDDAERNLRKDWFGPMFDKLRSKVDEIIELGEDLLAVQLSRIEIRRRALHMMKQKHGADKKAQENSQNRGILPLHSKPMRSVLKSIENSPKCPAFPSTSTSTSSSTVMVTELKNRVKFSIVSGTNSDSA